MATSDVNSNNVVEVVIGGKVVKLYSDENIEYIQLVTNYIDKKFQKIQEENPNLSLNTLMRILVFPLNIADDYFKEKYRNDAICEEIEKLKKDVQNLSLEKAKLKINNSSAKVEEVKNENLELLKEIEILKQENIKLSEQLKASKDELEEYIGNFENEKSSNDDGGKKVYKLL